MQRHNKIEFIKLQNLISIIINNFNKLCLHISLSIYTIAIKKVICI